MANELYRSQVYVLTVQAYDDAFPDVYAQEDIYIDVIRNPNAPQFENNNNFYTTSKSENVPLGTLVLCVNATDRDGDVVSYQMQDNLNQLASRFFFMTTRGCIYVQRNLFESDIDTYTFTVQARDNAYPEKFATTNVQIVIIRDQFAPVFTQQNYVVTIQETLAVNSTLPVTVRASDNDLEVMYSMHGYDICH